MKRKLTRERQRILYFNKRYKRRVLNVLKDEKIVCVYCGEEIIKSKEAKQEDNIITVDHIKPISKGGKDRDINNVCLACYKCNKEKGDTIIDINLLYRKFENLGYSFI